MTTYLMYIVTTTIPVIDDLPRLQYCVDVAVIVIGLAGRRTCPHLTSRAPGLPAELRNIRKICTFKHYAHFFFVFVYYQFYLCETCYRPGLLRRPTVVCIHIIIHKHKNRRRTNRIVYLPFCILLLLLLSPFVQKIQTLKNN